MIASPARSPRRRALVSVALLIALIILGLVAASLLKVGLARRARVRAEERQLQADLLADSGLARALARVADDPRYEGETWDVAADDLGGRGRARIAIEARPGPAAARDVRVVADYFAGPRETIRRTRTFRLPPPPPAPR